ncbi:hypothetical protein Pmani_017035 [Petrolisthes manimaculis]|uniref:PiggyBac transposable element-derived protein domain-containing protein n=1 Tax=Petrolisthes manimaculis TaxID=1843537 RepID=A0AAE1PP82_9EUCA|nr:hypothetical protein Pmani_017035 [Petrolisthes manimaculis]
MTTRYPLRLGSVRRIQRDDYDDDDYDDDYDDDDDDDYDDDYDDDDDDEDMTSPHHAEDKTSPHQRTRLPRMWKKEDITHLPLSEYQHPMPQFLQQPNEFFIQMFPKELLEDIVYQTNLYAQQMDVNTTFSINMDDLMVFMGIILYMGVMYLPSINDYWALDTRVSQVTHYMTSRRFKQIRTLLHFNNNEYEKSSTDRFYKVRPLFTNITQQFLQVKATPIQIIDEVIVGYKGTMAGNLRHYMPDKLDKFGYKLFCRASSDGFIHDIVMYQGLTTFSNHPVDLSQDEQQQVMSSKLILVLVKTIQDLKNTTIYADNYFTSIQLVEFLMAKYECRYVGTARGTLDYVSSNGILAMCWKDNKQITILSSDVGVEPISTTKRWNKDTREKPQEQTYKDNYQYPSAICSAKERTEN